MDHYHIWADLRPGVKDLDFVAALHAMLGPLQKDGLIHGYTIGRRKLGFGPEALGEWHIDIQVQGLAQLQDAFDAITPRTGEREQQHAAVWSKVTNFRSGLWRDFPDANRHK